jgi:hypothetical protein
VVATAAMMIVVYAVDRIRFAIQPYLRARALLTHMQQQEQRCISAQRIRWRSCIRASLLHGQTRAERVSFQEVVTMPVHCCQPRERQRNCGALVQQTRASSMRGYCIKKLQEQLPIKTASQAGARTCGSGSGNWAWSTAVARRPRSWPGQRRSRRRKGPTGCCSSSPPHHE